MPLTQMQHFELARRRLADAVADGNERRPMTTPEEKAKRALEIRNSLAHFNGTEQWFRHSLMRNVLYTEGVQYLAEQAEAYWLIDKIASMQLEPMIAAEPFQAWKLALTSDNKAVLTCTDGGKLGDEPELLHKEHITFTDFPLDEIELWVEKGEHIVILLPGEH
jgi:hypothetical protein